MKQKILIGAIAAAVLFGGAAVAGTVAAKNNQLDDSVTLQENGKNLLSPEEIKAIVLKEYKGIIDDIELERSFNKVYYEVEVDNGSEDVNLRLDAYTGKMVSVNKHQDFDVDDDVTVVDLNTTKKQASSSNQQALPVEEVKAIAEKEVGGKVSEMDLDDEAGRLVYEIELQTKTGETDVEIDAQTGKILILEQDN
ncbi:PepSY domain-containing protein [Bacillus rubiinfantis]|uniref:PepSY domain-containing protein n=1 Tax=Bacillus rubiinfantis TaxID=1499680 RepID=UPI0005A7FACC|nr:PepSY domain-containing protein [Bacillus rubiinfantis]